MDNKTYFEISANLLQFAKNIEDSKRPAYTGDNIDCLHNFKSVAERLGLTPLEVWGVYFLKHVDAIISYAKDKDIPQAESIDSRFADAINYLKLGYAIMKDNAVPDLLKNINTDYLRKESL